MARLIASTCGVGGLQGRGAEEIVSFAARVSNPPKQMDFQSAPRLLRYCIDNGHWSIFETASLTFEITTTRAIADQLLRHRSFCFQQVSQRYAESDDYLPADARRQDIKNRQNSIDDLDDATKRDFRLAQQRVWDVAFEEYRRALERGIAKECARFLLPLNTATVLYMTGNMRSWYHYCTLRCGNGTQLEHCAIATDIKDQITRHFPTFAAAFGWT